MYLKNERPIIRATIYYYDTNYDLDISRAVLRILKKYHMYPPEKIYAGKLTKNRFIPFGEDTDHIFSQAYCEKDVLQVDMANGEIRNTIDFWRVSWGLTFYKNSKLAVSTPKFMPWNTLSIDSTHDRLKDPANEVAFISCIKELIELLNPFYATIDDVNNKVQLFNRTNESKFAPDRIQQIYWGNYWGESLWQYRDVMLREMPIRRIEPLNNGVLFFLSDSILDFNSTKCHLSRLRIKKIVSEHLQIRS